ncbi:MAG TPA: type IV pilus twitching motility protein PilT [Thermoanaerobaculia bacterium]|nr:type IV pilus twitching motility protein PilT [Thermoanaerobaculia bacterium]
MSSLSGAGGPASQVSPALRRIDVLLRLVIGKKASDLHLAVGRTPMIRTDGDLEKLKWRVLTEEEFDSFMAPITPQRIYNEFKETGDTDFAYSLGTVARFRVNLFRQEHGSAAVLRLIPPRVLTIEDLGLPSLVSNIARVPRGLVLITGPTGSGKSTTLASLIDWVNKNHSRHIITIEDPVEFIHTPQRSLISHRELGFDTPDFASALKAALREDPDVVLVGELRDLETMSLALQAAETGLLVFGTLHTNSAAKAIDRLIDSFPAAEQEQARTVLAEALRAVVAQVLLKRKGGGRVPAFEVLRWSPALANSIREGKTAMITTLIQTGRNAGMVAMDQSLADLVVEDVVSFEEAFEKALDKEGFKPLVEKRRGSAAPGAR